MISLISRWKLLCGCPPELLQALCTLAEKVKESEPDTVRYEVNLPAPSPLNDQKQPLSPPPAAIPANQQTEVVFIEHYRNAKAFSDHINGAVFREFLTKNLKYFVSNPENPNWPSTVTTFLSPQSEFNRAKNAYR